MTFRSLRGRATLGLALAAALVALPAHAIDDRLTVRVGALQVDATSELRGRTQYQGSPYTFAQTFDGDETVPRIEAELRFGERHRLLFDHLAYERDREDALDEPISFDGVTIPAGSTALGDMRLRLAGLAYDFAVVETPTVSVGLQLGVQYARLDGRLRAVSGPNVYDERGDEDGALPVIGARVAFAPADRWRVVLQGRHFDSDWFDLDEVTGSLTRAGALVEYRVGSRVGVHAGYEWFRIDAQDSDGDGLTGLEQKLRGPTAGLTVAF